MIRLDLGVQQDFAVLDVIDQGRVWMPMKGADIQSFYQGKAPTEGRVKGSGLGLRSLVNMRWHKAVASKCANAPTPHAVPTSGCGCRLPVPQRRSRHWLPTRIRDRGPSGSRGRNDVARWVFSRIRRDCRVVPRRLRHAASG